MQSQRQWLPGEFCWVELNTTDTSAAKSFYEPLMQWNTESMSRYELWKKQDCTLATNMEWSEEWKSAGAGPQWSSYIHVEDIKAWCQKVESAGGKVLQKPYKVSDWAWMCTCQDPAGAVFCMWEAINWEQAKVEWEKMWQSKSPEECIDWKAGWNWNDNKGWNWSSKSWWNWSCKSWWGWNSKMNWDWAAKSGCDWNKPSSWKNWEKNNTGNWSWMELVTSDMDKACSFYNTVFGWEWECKELSNGWKYCVFMNEEGPVAGMMEMPKEWQAQCEQWWPAEWKAKWDASKWTENWPSWWGVHFSVSNLDDACTQAKELGGQQMTPMVEIAEIGKFCWWQDPQGCWFTMVEYCDK